jgi:hypothetical protein
MVIRRLIAMTTTSSDRSIENQLSDQVRKSSKPRFRSYFQMRYFFMPAPALFLTRVTFPGPRSCPRPAAREVADGEASRITDLWWKKRLR